MHHPVILVLFASCAVLECAAEWRPEDYGGKADDNLDDTPAIQRAIDAAIAAGPDQTVVLAKGTWHLLGKPNNGGVDLALLPALPESWPSGSVRGLRARGGFTVDIEWKDAKVTKYRIASPEPRAVKVRINGETKTTRSEKL
jgi:alpha-L-fucosidase 2